MDQLLRTFIAIELDPSLQEMLGKIQEHLKKSGADVKWVKPSHIHVTLKFLGEIPLEQVEKVKNVMHRSLDKFTAFPLHITHLGAFPKMENPHIIWVGIDPQQPTLKDIAIFLEEHLSEEGLPKENRDFEPHITLGRMKHSINRFALSQSLREYAIPQPLTQFVKKIKLFKSTLLPTGPLYETLETVHLRS